MTFLNNIKKELKKYKLYNKSVEYKRNINFLLNALIDKDLILNYEIKENKIIINNYFNDNWINLYVEKNYRSEFLISVNIEKIVIFSNIGTIKINDNLYLNIENILFNYYEYY